jgi:serine O-acetyltransferase
VIEVLRKLTGLTVMGTAACAALARSPYGRRAVEIIREDVKAVKERDPAATSTLEILTSYSGLHAIWSHRLAHKLWLANVPLLPRWISQISRFFTQIEIHPGAQIGRGLFIDHGSGVVIGETTEIGNNVTLYQGVTLGGTGKETGKRHPTLGDNVVVGAGAKLLGSIKIGDDAKIGAGSVVVQDVPVGNPGRPVLIEGERVGIPDIDYRHLPDPVAEAVRCLVTRIVEIEQELDEVHPDRAERRRRAVEEAEAVLEELLGFEAGSGI